MSFGLDSCSFFLFHYIKLGISALRQVTIGNIILGESYFLVSTLSLSHYNSFYLSTFRYSRTLKRITCHRCTVDGYWLATFWRHNIEFHEIFFFLKRPVVSLTLHLYEDKEINLLPFFITGNSIGKMNLKRKGNTSLP